MRSLLETMLPDPLSGALANAPLEDEEVSDEENQAAARSKEWFKDNQGTSVEDVAAELGSTIRPAAHRHEHPDGHSSPDRTRYRQR